MNAELFRLDALSNFIAGFVCLFFVLIFLYSVVYMRGRRHMEFYDLCIIMTFVVSLGAVYSNNLILFIVFWGFLGILLYLLILFGTAKRAPQTAKKAFLIVGSTDALMLLGLAILWKLSGVENPMQLTMSGVQIPLTSSAAIVAYLCLAIGALAKAGAMPVHTWVPDTAEDAPIPVTAYLPASLDKLLGIYFLVRLSLDMFVMTAGMNTLLMALGSLTIVAAVMMALVQHDLKRLLGYHAVSQVGYMVLGIGTGNPIGIAGGLFHMLNHAIYKSCLFLSGGAVEKVSGTSDLEKMGGYGKVMPITFMAFLIGALSISGVPPFNGFASKWLVYQGVIEAGRDGGFLWVVWLLAAMLGSALTLASFMKLLHAVFLGTPSSEAKTVQETAIEVEPGLWMPPLILAVLCVIFGIFAAAIPLAWFIYPSLPFEAVPTGLWSSGVATALLILALVIGAAIYWWGAHAKVRVVENFVGGESLRTHPEMRVSGVDFYRTVEETAGLRALYRGAERKFFDLYDVGRNITFSLSHGLSFLHSGALPLYLGWCLLGLIILLFVLLW